MVFSAEKDWLYGGTIWVCVGLFLILPFFEINGLFYLKPFHPISFLFSYSFVAFFLWIWFGTNYKLDRKQLQIKSGPFKKTIPIQSIRGIKFVKNPLTGPVLSMNKIEVLYGKYDIITVSPKNRQAFINQLMALNPGIEIKN